MLIPTVHVTIKARDEGEVIDFFRKLEDGYMVFSMV
jgi:hypothetical protein